MNIVFAVLVTAGVIAWLVIEVMKLIKFIKAKKADNKKKSEQEVYYVTGVQIIQAIIEIMIAGIEGIATGLGAGFSSLAEGIFLTTVEGATTLSVFGSLVIVFAGISLALGLCRWVLNFVTSLGQRNR